MNAAEKKYFIGRIREEAEKKAYSLRDRTVESYREAEKIGLEILKKEIENEIENVKNFILQRELCNLPRVTGYIDTEERQGYRESFLAFSIPTSFFKELKEKVVEGLKEVNEKILERKRMEKEIEKRAKELSDEIMAGTDREGVIILEAFQREF